MGVLIEKELSIKNLFFQNSYSDPATRHGGAWGERKYSSYSFLTSALDRGEWSESRPGRALPLGKGPPVPIVQEAGWAPEPVWTQRLEEKSSAFQNSIYLQGLERLGRRILRKDQIYGRIDVFSKCTFPTKNFHK
jgi:hypothetical protein